MSSVIIAEKPSVAKNIADALNIKNRKNGYFEGDSYIVTWAFGHLLQLLDSKDYDDKMAVWEMGNFPFIPKEFKYKVKSEQNNKDVVDLGALNQIELIKNLINNQEVKSVISACDYDREGQIIGDIILDYLDVKKPIYRLLLNEWTEKEVLKGLKNLKDNKEMKSLKDAGISRQWADWTIGINLTSVATLKYKIGKGGPLNIGRVLLPTLKIIYDRDQEIKNFKPDIYYKLKAEFEIDEKRKYQAYYYIDNEDKFKDNNKLKEDVKLMKKSISYIADKKTENKKEYPAYLFNLSNLQGYVTSKYKNFTSDKVLKIAQDLYEKKHITYPRTSSFVLEESLVDKTKKVLNTLCKNFKYKDEIKFIKSKRIFDNSKVESHSAIVPTYVLPKNLTKDEQIIYDSIKNRFLMQFMPIAEHQETKIITKFKDENIKGEFITKGKIEITKGWKKIENIKTKEVMLPKIDLNEESILLSTKITKKSTNPPKYHNEKTLLRLMETCGKKVSDDEVEQSDEIMNNILKGFSIGTPATRADTIKKLKTAGYITTNKKSLTCTEKGNRLVRNFPIKELFDLEYTGRLEKTLSDIEKNKFKREEFLEFIYEFTKDSVEKIKKEKRVLISKEDKEGNEIEVIGKCPNCNSDIIEGKIGYGCSNYIEGCKFTLWKNDKFLASFGIKLTKEMAKEILKNNRLKMVNVKSKKGNVFNAYFKYVKDTKEDRYSWKLEFLK